MAIEPSAMKVPNVAWEYWGWIETMNNMPGLYGLDKKRSACHKRLCGHYKLTETQSRDVTDHLDKYENACQMHDALISIKETLNLADKL